MADKKTRRIMGIVLLIIGSLTLGDQLNLWHSPLAFKGWWTFLIIIPFMSDIFSKGIKLRNTLGLAVGILFLLNEWGIMALQKAFALLLPLSVIVLGVVFVSNQKR